MTSTMNIPHVVLLTCVVMAHMALSIVALSNVNSAYPSPYGEDACVPIAASNGELKKAVRRELYGEDRIIDITHRIQPDMPLWLSSDGIGEVLWLQRSIKNGSHSNASGMKLFTVHTGTHVDAPGHFYDEYFDAGFDTDTLDLEVLNVPALLVDVPKDTNITAEVMKSLHVPKGVKRVLFRTLNTDRRLMWRKEFDSSYVGFTKDGAQWLVDNTDIKLIGLDYLSVGTFVNSIPVHNIFLKSREIILVEGLKLVDIKPGVYMVHCLPLRILGAEGTPIRCILVK